MRDMEVSSEFILTTAHTWYYTATIWSDTEQQQLSVIYLPLSNKQHSHKPNRHMPREVYKHDFDSSSQFDIINQIRWSLLTSQEKRRDRALKRRVRGEVCGAKAALIRFYFPLYFLLFIRLKVCCFFCHRFMSPRQSFCYFSLQKCDCFPGD